ncbi:MAG: hypothetical protein IPP88_05515 [Betaproteobacteria bacterium]|nr:hypothetical protein [Betaproteobacteria bacterium]
MNTFKMKSMHVAVLAGLAAIGAAGTAEAVHINPDGTGQVLIYPYYTARAGQATLITIINSQNNTKMVKVRFLEGKNSREVLDFNLYLSPADVWTGAIVGTTNGARVVTNDNSCVTPSDLFAETRTDGAGNALNEFKNYQYTGTFQDAAVFASLDRTREGYFEVIEMGVIDDNTIDGDVIGAGTAATVTGYIKHNSAGVPANCGALDSFDDFAGNPATTRFPNTGTTPASTPVTGPFFLTQPPRGGLTGRASIISSATGSNYTYSPTAFDAWSTVQKYTESGNLLPSIASVDSTPAAGPTSNVFTSAGIVTTVWPLTANGARDAMSATMMRNTVINEYILDAATASQTDWIVTFPTKRSYVNAGTGAATAPFSFNFPNSTTGSCDPYGFSVLNREEGVPGSLTPIPNPSPLPPGVTVAGAQLCWEANVVPFAASSLVASQNTNPLITSLQQFVNGATTVPGSRTTPTSRATQGPNGYMFMNFNALVQVLATTGGTTTRTPLGGAAAPVAAAVYNGLPVVGVMLHNYQNTGVVSRYGGTVDHKFTRSITP